MPAKKFKAEEIIGKLAEGKRAAALHLAC